jgi:hypothetical protein
MRATTLGRWLFRLVVTIGAGSAALGLSVAVAHADVAAGGRVVTIDRILSTTGSLRPVTVAPQYGPVTGTPSATASPDPGVYVAEDWGWE